MKQYKQIITIIALLSVVIALLSIFGQPNEIFYFLAYMAILFIAISLKNALVRKNKVSMKGK